MYEFKGKTAFVTGAARGIGKEVATRLAREGTDLVLVDILEKALNDTAEEITQCGVEALPLTVDVRNPGAVHKAAEKALERYGQIDFLVNVAGVGPLNSFFDISEENWDQTMDINLKGTFLTCQVIGKHMAGQRAGKIVNISSIAGKTGDEIAVPYCASKGGVNLLTQSTARALAPFGVNVNAVCPGLVWTPMWEATATWIGENQPDFKELDLSPEQIFDAVVQAKTPLGIPTTPGDVAAAVAFLLSDEARLITGQAINVDGGIEVH